MSISQEEGHSLVHALRRMGLVREAGTTRLTPLTGGVSSVIVLAETPRGLLCVKQALPRLKVAQERLAPIERNQAEVAWLRLAAQIAPGGVPQVLGEDGKARTFAMAYLEPRDYSVWKAQLKDGVAERRTAREAHWGTVVSARSGEREDVTVVHLAVGWNSGQLNVGSFARSERMVKWNEALRIEAELGAGARFAGRDALPEGVAVGAGLGAR